jgi:hypothetical protein
MALQLHRSIAEVRLNIKNTKKGLAGPYVKDINVELTQISAT